MSFLKESFKFIKESRDYIISAVVLFFIFSCVGFFFPIFTEEIMSIISKIMEMFEGLNLWQTIGLIFFNNARASLLALVLGIFFGVFPLVILMFNGYLLGVVAKLVSDESSLFALWKLLPHGIFELPAVLISIGFGLKIGIEILTKPTKENLFKNLNRALKTFVLIIVPLLIIAAIIEGVLVFFS